MADLRNKIELVAERNREEVYQTEIIKAQERKLTSDIIAHKLLIEKIKPQH